MKKIIYFLAFVLLFIAVLSVLLIAFLQVTEFTPEKKIPIHSEDNYDVLSDNAFTVMTWNTGFAGLGKDMSFFYDGGERSMPTEEWHHSYRSGIDSFIKVNEEEVDFFILQEVDNGSKRSYYSKQAKSLAKHEEHHHFAINYDVKYIPSPMNNPMGRTHSGLLNLSDYDSKTAMRYQYPSSYTWPNNLFFLKRCFLVENFVHQNGKELVIINTHNSAYDDGSLKATEMEYLRQFAMEEYSKGNYVLIGGDFNQQVPGEHPTNSVSYDYIEGWKWAYDTCYPTCRALDKPYSEACRTKVIDFFLMSPNVKLIDIEVINMDFKYSDHQPVVMQFQI